MIDGMVLSFPCIKVNNDLDILESNHAFKNMGWRRKGD